ncbi:MAG: hypothetical protein Q9221_005686 [Calogaya cf. arnoldii]
MEETMPELRINMTDICMREQPLHASLHSQAPRHSHASAASAATHQTNNSTVALKDVENMRPAELIDKRSHMVYLHGWRLYLLTFADDLNGFHKSSWVITSYLLTYTGFLIIIAKLSDIFGRKPAFMSTIVVFLVFSAGCGGVKTLDQLSVISPASYVRLTESSIVLRAFQGIGAGGIYTLSFVIASELVPLTKLAGIAALLSAVFAISSLLGPILGGLICDHGSWRGVFYLNIPAGIISLVLIFLLMPHDFPFMGKAEYSNSKLSMASVRKIDFTGATLLLAASVLLVAALEEGGTEYTWTSAVPLVLLFLSVFAWLAFFIRERMQSKKKVDFESVLPWQLVTNRFWASMILHAFFTGIAYLTMVIDLPQKFQVVNSDSAFKSGYRLLALMMSFSFAAVVSSILTEKKRVPPLYTLFVAASLQILGLALMTILSTTNHNFPSAQYGYQIIMGFGFGLSISTLIMSINLVVTQQDAAVTMGAIAQARTMGGSIGISICTNLLNDHIKSGLKPHLAQRYIDALLASARTIERILPEQLDTVKRVYSEGYRLQAIALTAFSGVAFCVVVLMWEQRPRRIPSPDGE